MDPSLALPSLPTGYQMIREVEIRNSRVFEQQSLSDCRRVNIFVGDNGTGKTTILEAIFLALGSSTELSARYRTQRGFGGLVAGTPKRVEEAIWRDFFFLGEWQKREIFIETKGDGEDSRSLTITRKPSQLFMPLTEQIGLDVQESISAPVTFVWRDHLRREYSVTPKITNSGIEFKSTEEDLPDFFYFSAGAQTSATENAGRFSELSQVGKLDSFVKMFTNEYPIIKDLRLEVVAGSPVIFATLRDLDFRLALANVSGGINRIMGVMLGIASRSNSVVLVDEVDDGLYYKHHGGLWRALLSLIRENNSQIFATTHNEEWLSALYEAAGKNVDDIAFWRIERIRAKSRLSQFSGKQMVGAIKVGEVR